MYAMQGCASVWHDRFVTMAGEGGVSKIEWLSLTFSKEKKK